MLDETAFQQYGEISVSGVATTPVNVSGTSFYGVESPILNMGDGSSAFTFENKITNTKLGELKITKTVNDNGYPATDPDKLFRFLVTLDGDPLPIGTVCSISDGTTYTVTEEGCIEIKADQTATISNILAGSEFTVEELSSYAKGYTVSYGVSGSSATTTDRATGIIPLKSDDTPSVTVTVTNTAYGTKVEIPVTKRYAFHDGGAHTYTFHLEQVADAQGTSLTPAVTLPDKTVTFNEATGSFSFEIGYAGSEFDSLPATRYYKITEGAASDSQENTQSFIAEVKIEEAEDGIKATLVKLHGSDTDSADFVNTLVGSLSLSKTVKGSSDSAAKTFDFDIILTPPEGVTLPSQFTAIVTDAEGTPVSQTAPLLEGNRIGIDQMAHGEKVTILGIPVGTTWTITETTTNGFTVTTGVTTHDGTTSGTGAVTSGSIVTGETEVAYTNTQTYVLPETGGTGPAAYTMAGWMLMLSSTAYLLYRHRKRRRGGV